MADNQEQIPLTESHGQEPLEERQEQEPLEDRQEQEPLERSQEETMKDHGWAWVICAAVFVTMFLDLGLMTTYGILFMAFQDLFDSSSSSIALIMGVYAVVYSISSLVSCNVLLGRCSTRQVTMAGGVFTGVGVALDVFAPSVSYLMCTHGVLVGTGHGMVFGPSIVILGSYFDKMRTFVTGLVLAGGCIGGIILPPFSRFLIDQYGIRGAKLILGAVMLNIVPAGMLQRPPRHRSPPTAVEAKGAGSQCVKLAIRETCPTIRPEPNVRLQGLSFSLSDIPKMIATDDAEKYDLMTVETDISRRRLICLNKSLPTNLNSYNERDCSEEMIHKQSQSDTNISRNVKRNKNRNRHDVISKLWSTLDKSLMKSVLFWFFMGVHLFGYCGLASYTFFLPPIAKENGISDVQSALLVSLHAGLDLVCRIVTGLIADFGVVQRYKILAAAYIILGLVYQFVKYYTTFELMVLYVVVFGTFSGCFYSLHPSIAVDYFGQERFAKVFGCVQFCHGLAVTVGYPVIGALRDFTGSYTAACHLNGVAFFVAALLLLSKPCLEK